MSTVLVTEFLPYVFPSVPKAPYDLVMQKINSALIDFCERTDFWQEELEPITLIPAIRDIEIYVPDDTYLAKILRLVHKNTKEIVAQSSDWLDRNEPNWRTKNGIGDFFVHKDKAIINLSAHPIDTEVRALTGRLSLKPKRSATSVNELLFEDYCEQIAAGAKALLFNMKNKSWSNPGDADNEMSYYMDGVNSARNRAQDNLAARVRRRSKAYY